ncbi:Response regulator [Burkholderia dolosa AU0158]|nr:Response regulator [Burkholderia dolosa AU0158]
MIKVLIADDHTLVRDGLRHILRNATGFDVAGEACDGPSTIALVRATPAQVLVLDLSMPGRNGVELIKQIKDEKPALRVLVLTMHAERQYAVRAFRAGASGLSDEGKRERRTGSTRSRKVASGGVYVSLAMAEQVRAEPERAGRYAAASAAVRPRVRRVQKNRPPGRH